MSDHSKLKQLAEASIQAWEKHSKADSHEFHDAWCKAVTEFSAAAREEVVLALIAESETRRVMIKEMDLMFGRYILAMRSALIEEEHGKGPVAAMEWIYNHWLDRASSRRRARSTPRPTSIGRLLRSTPAWKRC
ncbi:MULTISPECIES: hypothetical protein [unclassified Pseudomonas]|uniref:hypothetical protein n=1 Tax=unclassified Pseudomonas TaxID=196821 RepID=UPI000A1DEFE9|nr:MULTISPECIES: hypothetical protein [unclassified Pseudomonas]